MIRNPPFSLTGGRRHPDKYNDSADCGVRTMAISFFFSPEGGRSLRSMGGVSPILIDLQRPWLWSPSLYLLPSHLEGFSRLNSSHLMNSSFFFLFASSFFVLSMLNGSGSSGSETIPRPTECLMVSKKKWENVFPTSHVERWPKRDFLFVSFFTLSLSLSASAGRFGQNVVMATDTRAWDFTTGTQSGIGWPSLRPARR